MTDPQIAKYAAALSESSSSNLHQLFKQARENPHDDTLHGALADALEEEHAGSPVPDLIRKQFGLGQYTEPANNLWHEPVENSWDGTFPYAARLGKHGPFDLYLAHEGNHETQGENQRWVVHAVSNLKGSNDFGYSFEFPHEQAHLIPRYFPTASQHIDPISPEEAKIKYPAFNHEGVLNRQAREFERKMDEEQQRRN